MDLAQQLESARQRAEQAKSAYQAYRVTPGYDAAQANALNQQWQLASNDLFAANHAYEQGQNMATQQAYQDEQKRKMDEEAAYKLSQERSRAEFEEQFRRQRQVDAYRKQQADPHGSAIRQMLK